MMLPAAAAGSRQAKPHYLMIYIEPTPYILGLVREVEKAAPHPVRTLFISENVSQSWGLSVAQGDIRVLPASRLSASMDIVRAVASKPKVLHLAGWGHPLLLFALFAGALFRVPVTMESDRQLLPMVGPNGLLPKALPRWKRAVKRLLFPWMFRMVYGFLPGGSRQAQFFRHYDVPEKKIRAAQMTVDVEQIAEQCEFLGPEGRAAARQRLGIGPSNIAYVIVARLVVGKGLADLVSAFGNLDVSEPAARLIVVGDGPLMDNVAAAAAANAAIRLTGRLDHPGVIEILHAADVAVVPSYYEGWGLVVNEAMAAGLPVVASDRVGAVDDLVRDGETGIVFPAGDIEALTRALHALAADRDLRDRYGSAGQQLISGWTLRDSARIILGTWSELSAQSAPREVG